jgi:hypothetical protein
MWEIFRRKPRPLQTVTTGRFEIERNGEVAYLEYSLAGNILELTHTEVPDKLRHMDLASDLAFSAQVKDHVVCEHPDSRDSRLGITSASFPRTDGFLAWRNWRPP